MLLSTVKLPVLCVCRWVVSVILMMGVRIRCLLCSFAAVVLVNLISTVCRTFWVALRLLFLRALRD